MEPAARRLPFETTRPEQPRGLGLKFDDQPFVSHLVHSHGQDRLPVLHQSAVIAASAGQIFTIVGPPNVPEIGHPARHRHVAQVAAHVDERSRGNSSARSPRYR